MQPLGRLGARQQKVVISRHRRTPFSISASSYLLARRSSRTRRGRETLSATPDTCWRDYQRKHAGVTSRPGRHRRDSCQQSRHARGRPEGAYPRKYVICSGNEWQTATVHRLSPAVDDITLGHAVDAYLATLRGAEQAGTRRVYGRVLRRAVAEFGAETAPRHRRRAVRRMVRRAVGRAVAVHVERRPRRRPVGRGVLAAAGMDHRRPVAHARRRKPRPDRSRALSRADVEQLLTREDIGLRERTLWRMLYETAARSAEVLAPGRRGPGPANRRAKVRRKGGAVDVIVWQTGTARLLPRLLKGRKTGPVFVTERKARVQLPPCDLDPARPRPAVLPAGRGLFKEASGGATLHQLRHSALTHDAEDGTGDADADGPLRSHVGRGRWPGTRECPPRRWRGTRPSATPRAGGSAASPGRPAAPWRAVPRVPIPMLPADL